MTTEFEMFEDELIQCEWYLMPIEMQRMYIMFLANTQNPIEISSYGGLVCSRETLKKVFTIEFLDGAFKLALTFNLLITISRFLTSHFHIL